MDETQQPTQPLVHDVAEVATMLGLCRTATYAAIGRGEIPAIRIGRRLVVPKIALQRLLEARLAEASK